jgi:hypothetical protein
MRVERKRMIAGAFADALSVAGISLGGPAFLAALVSWDAWFLRFLFTPAALCLMAAIATVSFFTIVRWRRAGPETRTAEASCERG